MAGGHPVTMYATGIADKAGAQRGQYTVLWRRDPILGVVRNVPSNRLPARAWLTCHNAVIRDGQLEKVRGWTLLPFTVEGSVSLVQPINYARGGFTTVIGTHQYLYNLRGMAANKLNNTHFNMAITDRWSADYLAKRWYFGNLTDGVKCWKGSGDVDDFDTGGVRSRHLSQFANHILLGHCGFDGADLQQFILDNVGDVDGRYCVAGSDILRNGLGWTFADEASDAFIQGFPDGGWSLQQIKRLYDILVVYKEDTIDLLQYTGTDQLYNRIPRQQEVGLMAPFGVIGLKDQHLFPGQDNLYAFNASTAQAFGDRVWDWWIQSMKGTSRARIHGMYDRREDFREAHWGYQPADVASVAQAWCSLVFNTRYNAFTTRDWPFQAVGYARSQYPADQPLMFDELAQPMNDMDEPMEHPITLADFVLVAGNENGQLFQLDETVNTAAGANVTMTLESGDADDGAPNDIKYTDGMDIELSEYDDEDGAAPLQLYIAPRLSLEEELVWQGPFTYDGLRGFDYDATYRFIRYKFEQVGGRTALRGYGPRVELAGRY